LHNRLFIKQMQRSRLTKSRRLVCRLLFCSAPLPLRFLNPFTSYSEKTVINMILKGSGSYAFPAEEISHKASSTYTLSPLLVAAYRLQHLRGTETTGKGAC